MNVNRLNLYSLGVAQKANKPSLAETESKKDDNKQTQQHAQADAQSVLNSLDLLGQQNKIGVTQTIDPTKYLSPERIAEIEASMGAFEYGVEAQLEQLNNEFGQLAPYSNMPEAEKVALAAQTWTAANE